MPKLNKAGQPFPHLLLHTLPVTSQKVIGNLLGSETVPVKNKNDIYKGEYTEAPPIAHVRVTLLPTHRWSVCTAADYQSR